MMHPSLSQRVETMGTVITIDLYDHDCTLDPRPYLAAATAVFVGADLVFSTYHPQSPVSRLRRGDLSLADAPPLVQRVYATCRDLVAATDGLFDPWALPGGFDPSGYVKGFAAHRALDCLIGLAPAALVNAAGDVASFVASDRPPFRIGLTDPRDSSRLAGVVATRQCVATSGTYEIGEHLYDPRAGTFSAGALAATVTGPDLGVADALATALCVGGANALFLLERFSGYHALVTDDAGQHQSPGFVLLSADA